MRYFFIILMLITLSGCKMLKNEVERSVQKDFKEYLDKNFDAYAEAHHQAKMEGYKQKVSWVLGTSGGTIALISGIGGVILLKRKLFGKG